MADEYSYSDKYGDWGVSMEEAEAKVASEEKPKKKKKKRKKPMKEGLLEKQGYMSLYEGPSKKAKKKRRFTKVDEEV